jgi:hypothetical protein
MTTKSDHENAALQAFCDELTARGSLTEITAYPDRDPEHPLTVDALISINGTEWAVEHCLLSRPPQLPPALKKAEATLQPPLDAIAQAHNCVIHTSYLPQTGAKGEQWGAAYYDQIVKMAEQAAAMKPAWVMGEDGFTTVRTVPSETPHAVFVASITTTRHPGTGTQVDAGLRDPLLKKLDCQLRKAKEASFPTALLLDQTPRPGSNSHTVWIASPNTVAMAAATILRDHGRNNPKVLDQVWLRPAIAAAPLNAPSIHLLIA